MAEVKDKKVEIHTLIEDLDELGLGGVRSRYYMRNSRGYQVLGVDYRKIEGDYQMFVHIRYVGEDSPSTERSLKELAKDRRTPAERLNRKSFNAWNVK